MKLKNLKISQLKPYWRNPRKNDDAVEHIMKSIEDYGYNQPIVVDEKNVIIVGHTRYKAITRLGWESVDVLELNISAQKAKEYRIVDNKSSELAEWDFSTLIPELREIAEIDNIRDYFKDVEMEDIQRASESMADKFSLISSNVQIKEQSLMHITCPHCSEEFTIEPNSKNT
jgi:ParB-like chromosome segregation protein Spo0J